MDLYVSHYQLTNLHDLGAHEQTYRNFARHKNDEGQRALAYELPLESARRHSRHLGCLQSQCAI